MNNNSNDRYDNSELSELLDSCVAIKRKLVGFVTEKYFPEVRAQLATSSKEVVFERETEHAIEAVIYDQRHKNGETVIDRFVRETPELSHRDAEIALGWRESVLGVFHLGRSNGPTVDSVNLVDDLNYRLVSNTDTKEIRRVLSSRGFLFSRIVPVLDAWMLSGSQGVLVASEKRMAFGMAAEMARNAPRLFFRNPKNLEKSLELENKKHLRFVEYFGAPWVVGTAKEIEDCWRKFMLPDSDASVTKRAKEMFVLPRQLHKAETVGMIQDPREGMYFLNDFGVFLDALHDSSRVKKRRIREVLMGYLESPGVSPAIFSLVAKERPDALCEMLARLFDHPSFDWERDGESCLRKYNPEFAEQPRFPSTQLFNDDLVDGFKYIKERDATKTFAGNGHEIMADDEFFAFDGMPPSHITGAKRKRTKTKRKQVRKASKRNRK